MNEVIMINRLTPSAVSDQFVRLTLIIDNMHQKETCDRIVHCIDEYENTKVDHLIMKYNGIIIPIELRYIPELIALFSANDIRIYSVFEMYD